MPKEPILLLPGEITQIIGIGKPVEGLLNASIKDLVIIPREITSELWTGNEITLTVKNPTKSLIVVQGALARITPNSRIMWTETIGSRRPSLEIFLEGTKLNGMIDTGADTTVLALTDFKHIPWTGEVQEVTVLGVGGPTTMGKVLTPMSWQCEKHQGKICPLINANLDTTLWGRDLLNQMHCVVTSDS